MELFLNILLLAVGFLALIKGADFFVDGSSALAKNFKVPGVIIGLTIVQWEQVRLSLPSVPPIEPVKCQRPVKRKKCQRPGYILQKCRIRNIIYL